MKAMLGPTGHRMNCQWSTCIQAIPCLQGWVVMYAISQLVFGIGKILIKSVSASAVLRVMLL